MEQVFFRLHLRFVTTVTRLLPPQTRRVLEYVTLANAFCLLTSLVILHTHLVNPKGQAAPNSCLPVALERAGIDPARLHVLQIHIRTPSDSRARKKGRLKFLPISRTRLGEDNNGEDAAGGQPLSREGLHGRDICSSADTVGESGDEVHRSGNIPSQSFPPEVFYSMKQMTGKDAVGTLSGPGTLEIASRAPDHDAKVSAGEGVFSIAEGSCRSEAGHQGGRTGFGGVGQGGYGYRWTIQGLLSVLLWGTGARHDFTPAIGSRQNRDGLRGKGEAGSEEERGRRDESREEGDTMAIFDEVYLFSLEKGFLMLRPDLRQKHGIMTANVTIGAHDPCLGGRVIQALVKDFVGYDTVVMNWLISLYRGRGFLYSVQNNELFNLNYAAEFVESTEDVGKFLVFKVGVMFTTLFLFFTTTTLVSFTLRETQERMLKFTFLLQHHVRHRLPYAPLIFTHVVESLVFVPIMVGILFFLFEFFSDQLLAFMVLSVVWLCEVYSVVSVRTTVCIRFFPQVFFLYFTLFHIYFFSFPFGFSYLALVTTVLFLQHSMLYFWNRYEVPALRAGHVSAARPRQAGMVIGVIPRYDPQGIGIPIPSQVQPERRPRAATVAGEPPRESPLETETARTISRSNSSPTPNSLAADAAYENSGAAAAAAAGGEGRRGGGGGGVGHGILNVPPSTITRRWRSGPTFNARPASPRSQIRTRRDEGSEEVVSVTPGVVHDVGGPARDVVGSGSSSGDVNSTSSGPVSGFSRTISAPLLGSFPFSFWNLVQIPSAAQTTAAVEAAAIASWQARGEAIAGGDGIGDTEGHAQRGGTPGAGAFTALSRRRRRTDGRTSPSVPIEGTVESNERAGSTQQRCLESPHGNLRRTRVGSDEEVSGDENSSFVNAVTDDTCTRGGHGDTRIGDGNGSTAFDMIVHDTDSESMATDNASMDRDGVPSR